ncbi:hypothetical protein ADIARSV_0513 [Arcticibacter svalbardensis MN12-7]|uniref:Uncharacterized protein n=1 Tax=Arcticibacter svalbardensis MN12-7 TaxID=1150600 RepID=R9GX96_9SPHI|nr:RagB/SusD family nutrient uptake outer membrane protein [Arcticibacter svalbardensis]EOR96278.1 hypothetical protein ADIARSV_0513 [Arcticibacter svalbardensis MN12-7]
MKTKIHIALLLVLTICSCDKTDDWLDAKQNKNDLVPTKLADFQSLLDNPLMYLDYPSIGLIGADNFQVTDANWLLGTVTERNAYIWKKDVFEGSSNAEWLNSYQKISYANIVLDGLDKITVEPGDLVRLNEIKGSALFFRSFAFYGLVQTFSKPYLPSTAASDPGIPILLSSDVNVNISRSQVKTVYEQIIQDLSTAENLLPLLPSHLTHPSGVAAQALLARVHLAMGNYEQALIYSSKVLQSFNTLVDFNSLTESVSRQFATVAANPPGMLFYAESLGYGILRSDSRNTVNPNLYQQYLPGDLRKGIFYRDYGTGRVTFKGSLTGSTRQFAGLASNEVYLINAEANIRLNHIAEGLDILNKLLKNRFKPELFQPYSTTDAEEALKIVLTERRKELPYTGQLRWEDLRRLNSDPRFAKSISHTVNGVEYILPPEDLRYVFPIPDDELRYNTMEQNLR